MSIRHPPSSATSRQSTSAWAGTNPLHLVEVRLERDGADDGGGRTPRRIGVSRRVDIEGDDGGSLERIGDPVGLRPGGRPTRGRQHGERPRTIAGDLGRGVLADRVRRTRRWSGQFGQRRRTELGYLRRWRGHDRIEWRALGLATVSTTARGAGDEQETDPDRVGERSSDRGCWRVHAPRFGAERGVDWSVGAMVGQSLDRRLTRVVDVVRPVGLLAFEAGVGRRRRSRRVRPARRSARDRSARPPVRQRPAKAAGNARRMLVITV